MTVCTPDYYPPARVRGGRSADVSERVREQIRRAVLYEDADLLVVADCVPVSYPDFHRDFLKNKAVMMGCPKFDDAQHYIEKFAQICKVSGIKSITSVVMEVPCCSQMRGIITEAMKRSGKDIPVTEKIISVQGEAA